MSYSYVVMLQKYNNQLIFIIAMYLNTRRKSNTFEYTRKLEVLLSLLLYSLLLSKPILLIAAEQTSGSDEIVNEYEKDIRQAVSEEEAKGFRHDNTGLSNQTNKDQLSENNASLSGNKAELVQGEAQQNSSDANERFVESENIAGEAEVVDSEQGLHFNVWEYRVEGNKLLTREQIERTVYPFLGPDKTIDTIEAARTNLEQVYRDNGYGTVFIDIPEQDVENGVVVLNVTEGKIERLKITGSRYYSLGKIREQIPALKEGFTPHLPEVQKQVAALNKGVTGRVITPVMKPGNTPGKLDVELKVKDEFPLHASLELNDRYTSNTSRLRLNANLRYDNLWQKGHSASLGYVVSPQDRSEVEVIFGTYLVRFPDSDNLLALYAVNSSSDVATTGEINQVGAGNIYGLRAIFPLTNIGNYTHNLTLGSDFKDFEETTSLLGVDALNTPASYLSFITSYTGNWFHESAKTSFTADIHFAPRGLGNTNKEFENKRVGARPNFSYLKTDLSHERKWLYDIIFKTRLNAQITDSPLISNEQFNAGGMDTVRGYLESQQLGDYGLIGSLEIHTPSFAKYIADYLNDFHFFAFVDGARLKIHDPLPDQISQFTLSSIGMGIELDAFDGISTDMLWAMVLSDNGDIKSGDSRFHFNLGYQF